MKNEIVRHIIQFSASNLVLQAALFVQNIFVANSLGPFLYGIFNGMQLILIYSYAFQFGAADGLHREIPILRGEKNYHQIKRTKDTALSFLILIGTLSTFVMLAIFGFTRTTIYVKLGLISVASISFLQLINNFYGLSFRAENKFELVSSVLIFNALIVILTIPLVIIFKYYGALASLFLASLVTLSYSWYSSRADYNFKFCWNTKTLKPLIMVGFPIMLLSFTAGIAETVDRIIILMLLDPAKLGYYAAPKTIVAAMGTLIIIPVTSVMYPRFTERFGATKKLEDLYVLIEKPTDILCLIIPVFAGAIYLGIPQLVSIFLPLYTSGINAAQILVVGSCFFAIFGVIGNFYPTTKKVFFLYIFQAITVLLNLAVSYMLVRHGLGITGVAIGRSLSLVIYVILIFFVAMKFIKKSFLQSSVFFAKKILPLLYCFIIALLLNYIIPAGSKLSSWVLTFFYRETVFFMATCWLLYLSWRKLNLARENG